MEVAVRQQSLCLLLEEGESRKSRALRINCRMCGCCFKTQFGNFTSGWISSENVFVAPTRKGETLPKWADLLKNELFVVLEEGESFSTRVCSPCGTKVRNCAAMLSQIREKLNTPTDNEQLLRLKKLSKSPHSNPLLRDLALLITIRENLNSLLTLKAHSRTRRKSLKIIQIQEALWRN